MIEAPGFDEQAMMRRALVLAEQAERAGEVPVGAVIVRGGQIIAEAHNQRELLAGPDGPCGNPGNHPGGCESRRVAARRMHAVRDARTLPHVRWGNRAGAHSPALSTAPSTPRPVRSAHSTNC